MLFNVTQEMYDKKLEDKVGKMSAAQLLAIPGLFQVVAKKLNDEILDDFREEVRIQSMKSAAQVAYEVKQKQEQAWGLTPDIWEELPDAEKELWADIASAVTAHTAGVRKDSVAPPEGG